VRAPAGLPAWRRISPAIVLDVPFPDPADEGGAYSALFLRRALRFGGGGDFLRFRRRLFRFSFFAFAAFGFASSRNALSGSKFTFLPA
jgi:hypothetical protein